MSFIAIISTLSDSWELKSTSAIDLVFIQLWACTRKWLVLMIKISIRSEWQWIPTLEVTNIEGTTRAMKSCDRLYHREGKGARSDCNENSVKQYYRCFSILFDKSSSETVNLNGVPRDSFFGEEGRNLLALISLELNNCASLVVDN